MYKVRADYDVVEDVTRLYVLDVEEFPAAMIASSGEVLKKTKHKILHCGKPEWVDYESFEKPVHGSLGLEDRQAQQLMDDLWDSGFRPTWITKLVAGMTGTETSSDIERLFGKVLLMVARRTG